MAHDGQRLVGYAQLESTTRTVEVVGDEVAVDALLGALEADGEAFDIWAHGEHGPVGAAARGRSYTPHRLLWQLRRPLVDLPPVAWPAEVTLRSFRVGSDERAWLALNAAVFATHPDQGGWTLADLTAREAESWFDPAGFLIAERDGQLLGFHWTKRHPDDVGEVYVLGVAPQAQGLRLGTALLGEGLRYLADAGMRSVLLYVDDDNAAALALYEKAGFARAGLDVQYRWEPAA